jgi:uncharacterized protein (TIGR02186 family)
MRLKAVSVLALIVMAAGSYLVTSTMAAPRSRETADPSQGIEHIKKKPTEPAPAPDVTPRLPSPAPDAVPAATVGTAQPQPTWGPEKVEADVSTRTVAVTAEFTGTEIIVFGSVANGRQESPEAGYYDVVMVVEGSGAASIVRLKENVAGLWVNSSKVRFDNLPLYSAIASTRPIEEIAEPKVLVANSIGFGRARMFPGTKSTPTTAEQLDAFKSAAIRLKKRDGLYVRQDYGVVFRGKSLFRANIKLPANIPVGPLEARVYLFREGKLLSSHTANVRLERQGFERLVYDFAFEHPIWYGIIAVLSAAGAGLLAAAVFQRPTS